MPKRDVGRAFVRNVACQTTDPYPTSRKAAEEERKASNEKEKVDEVKADVKVEEAEVKADVKVEERKVEEAILGRQCVCAKCHASDGPLDKYGICDDEGMKGKVLCASCAHGYGMGMCNAELGNGGKCHMWSSCFYGCTPDPEDMDTVSFCRYHDKACEFCDESYDYIGKADCTTPCGNTMCVSCVETHEIECPQCIKYMQQL